MTRPQPFSAGEGELIISGGGTTMVATDVVLANMGLMRGVQADAAGWRERIDRIRSLETTGAPAWRPSDAGVSLLNAALSVEGIEIGSRDLADKLAAAAEAYGQAERASSAFERIAGEISGWLLGNELRLIAPFVIVPAMELAVLLAAGAAIRVMAAGPAGTRACLTPAAGDSSVHIDSRLLTNSIFVTAVRVVLSSLDDVGTGFAGVPLPVSALLGEGGLGILGVRSAANGVRALGQPFGLLQDTPVSVTRQGPSASVHPPGGFAELAERIPKAEKDRPQVRIERYGDSEHPSWAVYVAGTVEWNPRSSTEPWDLTSNVAAMAQRNAGSTEAVTQAMHDAGISPTDPVVIAGHSQGGLVAQTVAADGGFTTVLVLTFGAPESSVPVPAGVTAVTVEHTDDVVPALGGLAGAAALAGSGVDTAHRTVVRQEAFHARAIPTDTALPAHTMSEYAATARSMDGSPDPRLAELRSQISHILGTDAGSGADWTGERLQPERAGSTGEG
ncbi:hypothetical protein JF66_06355 [Cryobacterium sp. MLB-32]|uniref:hypothetical protein n=1 Tax=Cryobacterium sp. MLB-32 TaxID=1529318 RepID=UPI0004E62386|nr:hypothetical protein [Cryobacterium sp. MLB-32]KFF60152.1 hypothetical protein JF66_06355 [Cryobacterium sp. MLB-32]